MTRFSIKKTITVGVNYFLPAPNSGGDGVRSTSLLKSGGCFHQGQKNAELTSLTGCASHLDAPVQ